ncbi:PTS fructose transporter subunit IIC [Desmospora activa]|uniref:PTS system D-fructose-specific IIB component (F1P-forming) (Frc family) /PTS system D-fructose-specific IIC component (F1P-forming) (Frc family) n=1 Tax=Desmospora activa DSM 45169 TaxID=1121389 RepID=A0A2T4Z6R1_9BACL|nr:fructose-specific PTS transporter subunit EIIC [Desmospora activa]PTM57568.1 PTS system D-fructose-specific IIB component (F1P-forming) (Frc family) /PTS system D-fructose-specific IIC component (F1P-forming) (Frc family) [Desmospora activa DSM 45169]
MKKLIAVTGCPTGIAHTYMAAESLQRAAQVKDVEIKVETRGATGVENRLTEEDILEAHAVILSADVDVEEERFVDKPIVRVALREAIKEGERIIEEALAQEDAPEQTKVEKEPDSTPAPSAKKKSGTGFYQHLMNGVSFMLPLVVAGGLIIALSFTFGIHAAEEEGSLAAQLMQIGGGSAFALMVPVLAGFIAYSIADKAGLAPGLVGGMLASHTGAGFLGGIVAGFLAGYLAQWLKKVIRLPRTLEGLKPIMIIPFVATLAVGLLMVYVIGTPVKGIMDGLTAWLQGLGTGNAALLGLLLGAMMAVDMGGPVNKAAYTFGVGLLGSGIEGPMAAVMVAGMTPPLGIWLATLLAKQKFNREEREAGKAAGVMGLAFITEGAIPFAAADPLRVIPSCIAGSAIAGAIAMGLGSTLAAPHGGIFVLPIPHAVGNLGMFVLALAVGTVVTATLLMLLKKKVTTDQTTTV